LTALSYGDHRETRPILASEDPPYWPPGADPFDNRTQAPQWARGVESEIDKRIVVDRRVAPRLSLAEILERYRREVTPTKRGAADENLRLKAMAQRPFAPIRMSALTSSHLAAYRDERLKVVSGATVNRELSVLSHAIDTARREYLPANPCTLVRRPPQGRARNRRLQDDEEQRLLEACRDARNGWLAHVALAIETDIRPPRRAHRPDFLRWAPQSALTNHAHQSVG
jgi:hypothetical protein